MTDLSYTLPVKAAEKATLTFRPQGGHCRRLVSLMLLCYYGRLFYSAPLVWATSALLVLSLALAAAVYVYEPAVSLSDTSRAWLLLVADHTLAGILLSSVLYSFILVNFTPNGGRVELFVLRCVSALLVSGASIALAVQLMPRNVLAASTVLYLGVSLNASCWWASLWLFLQKDGLAPLLPESLRDALLRDRLLDWLRQPFDYALLVQRLRQMLPLLVLPEEELHRGLALLPPELRARLQRPGLLNMEGEIPRRLRAVLEPWSEGPDYLRVRPLQLPAPSSTAAGKGTNGHVNYAGRAPGEAAPQDRAATDGRREGRPRAERRAAATVGQVWQAIEMRQSLLEGPEWLILYALRRHVERFVRGKVEAALASTATKAKLVLVLAAALAAAKYLRQPARARQLQMLLRKLLVSAAPAAVVYLLAAQRNSRAGLGTGRQ
ncbi:hypothetical protein AB1Y20_022542 [Prymnesium parvum]|uniref:Autophagy-related protein 9 n=1 Tax=Prymnesium parvum TaxID=97485 RepID=A0AB34JHI1_PRYPA